MQQVNLALRRCGIESFQSCRLLGRGAWHDAYLVGLDNGEQLVVRLRKTVIYGAPAVYDEPELNEDYATVGTYYDHANRAVPGICPERYEYGVSPELTFTLESYMGAVVPFKAWTPEEAHAYGERLGSAFRQIHLLAPAVPGYGPIVRTPAGLMGKERFEPALEVAQWLERFERLASAEIAFNRALCRERLESLLANWQPGPVALVNRDITPENLLLSPGGAPGLIDPVPRLGLGERYAAWFVFCYRFLLPALSEAPRYAHHKFNRYAPVLEGMAAGYEAGYGQAEAVAREYFLWLLEEAEGCLELLGKELTPKQLLQGGGHEALTRRMEAAVREMERLSARA